MKLADLRKVAVKNNLRIRFRLAGGEDCLVNEHGIAQVPALRSAPGFNLEEELKRVDSFEVEPVSADRSRSKPRPELITSEQLEAMAGMGGRPSGGHDEHED